MKIAIIGDTHGVYRSVEKAVHFARRWNCHAAFVAGDWGYWPHMGQGKHFIQSVSNLCVRFDMQLIWLDGNHENHDEIAELVAVHGRDDWIKIADRISYSPRGHRWEWDGVSFMTLGGAYSIDKPQLTPGVDWWAGETIKMQDAERAVAGGRVDVMLTHDAPIGVIPWCDDGREERFPESRANREVLSHVVDICQPKLLVHGHYHFAHETRRGPTHVVGLAADGQPGSMWVLNTDFVAPNRTINT